MEETQSGISQLLAFGDLEAELDMARRVIERVPEDKFDWKPHEKSYSLGQLTLHVANLLNFERMILNEDGFDLGGSPPPEQGGIPSKDDILAMFDSARADIEKSLDGFDVERMAQPWSLTHGDEEIFTAPRAIAWRMAGVTHLAHHRGQLTVYLRLLDVPVPKTYGPTADEQEM